MTAPTTLDLRLTPPPGGQVLHTSDRATVIWGDARDPAVIAAVPDRYGLLATDPPYGVGYESAWRTDGFGPLAGDDGTVDWPTILAEWVGPDGTHARGLDDKRHAIVFGYRPDQLAGPLRLSGTAELIWDKQIHGPGDLASPWGRSHEPITWGAHYKRPSDRRTGRGAGVARLRQGTILRALRPSGTAVRHPTEKPVALMAQLIESSSLRGDLVVDPCAGTGSTGVAAVILGRRCWLVEIHRDYAELAAQRVRDAEAIADRIEAA